MSGAPRAVPDRPAPGRERPGYLVVRADPEGAYMGALMVTDASGLPLDFRYTDPVTPTRLQRALYGGVLDRHLRTEVVARSLAGAVTTRPTLLLVDDRAVLDDPPCAAPTALIGPSAAAVLGAPGTVRGQGGDTLLVQVDEARNPVRVVLAGRDGADGDADAVVGALVALGAGMDVLEPLERVRAALDLIVAGDVDGVDA